MSEASSSAEHYNIYLSTTDLIRESVAYYRTLLEQQVTRFDIDAMRSALREPELAEEMVRVLRRRIGACGKVVVRHVRVDRSVSCETLLKRTGRTVLTRNKQVVLDAPVGSGDETDVYLFELDHFIEDDFDLDREYEIRGLKASDFYSLEAVIRNDQTLSERGRGTVATHWQDSSGLWCFAAFSTEFNDCERFVQVDRRVPGGWSGKWIFAGIKT